MYIVLEKTRKERSGMTFEKIVRSVLSPSAGLGGPVLGMEK
jgi:hypothetical protein